MEKTPTLNYSALQNTLKTQSLGISMRIALRSTQHKQNPERFSTRKVPHKLCEVVGEKCTTNALWIKELVQMTLNKVKENLCHMFHILEMCMSFN